MGKGHRLAMACHHVARPRAGTASGVPDVAPSAPSTPPELVSVRGVARPWEFCAHSRAHMARHSAARGRHRACAMQRHPRQRPIQPARLAAARLRRPNGKRVSIFLKETEANYYQDGFHWPGFHFSVTYCMNDPAPNHALFSKGHTPLHSSTGVHSLCPDWLGVAQLPCDMPVLTNGSGGTQRADLAGRIQPASSKLFNIL